MRSKCPTAFGSGNQPSKILSMTLISLALAGLVGCSPAYQLSQRSPDDTDQNDIPRLSEQFGNLGIYNAPIPRGKILLAALRHYGINSFDQVNAALQCDAQSVQTVTCVDTATNKACTSNTANKTTTTISAVPAIPQGCVPISPGAGQATLNIPTPVAAIIHAAVDECVFWTFQEDTTDISTSTWASLAGLGVLGAGIVGAVEKWSPVATTALSTTGAGVALSSGLQKAAPTPAQASVTSVIQAGLSYYPLLEAKALSGGVSNVPQKIAALSGLWDAAGSGCAPGVLKGHGTSSKHPADN